MWSLQQPRYYTKYGRLITQSLSANAIAVWIWAWLSNLWHTWLRLCDCYIINDWLSKHATEQNAFGEPLDKLGFAGACCEHRSVHKHATCCYAVDSHLRRSFVISEYIAQFKTLKKAKRFKIICRCVRWIVFFNIADMSNIVDERINGAAINILHLEVILSKPLAFGLCLKQFITCRTVGSPPCSPLMYSCWTTLVKLAIENVMILAKKFISTRLPVLHDYNQGPVCRGQTSMGSDIDIQGTTFRV